MQAPTNNKITQQIHGPYNAVDYSARPNPDFYAPEDGQIALIGTDATCGKKLWLQGATGRSGFCHIETYFVSLGQFVKRGQKLARMGYTGTTIPKGPGGRHCHQVLQLANGSYVYPPSRINQSFIKLGGINVQLTKAAAIDLYRAIYQKEPTDSEVAAYMDWSVNNPNQLIYETVIRNIHLKNTKIAELSQDPNTAQILKPNTLYKTP